MAVTTIPGDPTLISPERVARTLKRRDPPQHPDVDVRALEADLRARLEGEVRFDAGSRALYAVTGANYRHVPIGVCIPKTVDDVVALVAVCRRHGAPIVSRGGGTGLAGQTTNVAVVIDWSKYLNRIVAVDPLARTARVQPGLICDHLGVVAHPLGLTYAPQPATHDRCCFGGMLANNSCGIHAQMGGKAVDNTEAMDVLLYDGTRMSLGWMTEDDLTAAIARGGKQGEVYRRLRALRDRYAEAIKRDFPKLPRRVSGYNLDELLPGPDGRFNVARALVGSEGTCVTMLEMTVRLVPNPPERVLVVLGYPDVYRAADHIMDVLEFKPIGLEGMDNRLRDHVQKKGGTHARELDELPGGNGWLFVEFGADTKSEAKAQADRLVARLRAAEDTPHIKVITDAAQQGRLWEVREAGLGSTAFVPGESDTWEGWEDSAVPPQRMGEYLRELRNVFQRYEYEGALYGHFGMGCVHTRITFDLKSGPGIAKYDAFMDEVTSLVVRLGGSLSGEHGDGQSRAQFLPKMFGPEIMEAFAQFKAIWDPDDKMNPGKIVAPRRIDDDLRLGAGYHPWEPKTHFTYPQDHGSFAHATLRCVGIGKCRRTSAEGEASTMCPSFMVTREEKHSTRGRAHLLWEMLQDGPIDGRWKDESVKESLDLCLSCKGCKTDCPTNVDLATYKAEFLSHYYEGRLRPRHAYAFGMMDKWAKAAALVPGIANTVTQTPGLRAVAKAIAGVPQERSIPPFAAETFRSWFRKHRSDAPADDGRPRVVLWTDTWNNHFFPETAQAAVEALEHAGYAVSIPSRNVCCGRPLYDFGMLDRAKRYLERTLDVLHDELRERLPIVVLEPSCASVFRDELPSILPRHEGAATLTSRTMLLSELLASPAHRARGVPVPRLAREAIVQGHCHHKSVLKFDAETEVMKSMHLAAKTLDSGCCGMAGSFGYEKGKLAVSLAAGERVLLPAVRAASDETIVVADGFSCKEQIAQGTQRKALHLAEVLKLAIDHGPAGPTGPRPERAIVAPREIAQRRSLRRAQAGLALAGVAALALLVRRALRR